MTTNSPTSLLYFIRRRVGVGELVRRRVDWLPVGGVQFVVFEKFTNAHLQQIAREIMLLLVNNLHEKSIAGCHDKQKFDIGCMLYVICTHITT